MKEGIKSVMSSELPDYGPAPVSGSVNASVRATSKPALDHQELGERTFYQRTGKRWLDFSFAAAGLLALSPLLAATAIAVRATSPGPAFFRQKRTGQYGRPFLIYKFRSMVPGKSDAKGGLITAAGDPRITPLGRWLRKSKIDELPQLLNVLWGDMSLVGPRPEVPEYTEKYTERQQRVLLAKPGITGPTANAHVNEEELLAGREDKEAFYLSTVLPAKLETDLAYSETIRFTTDLKLILTTIRLVLARTPQLF
jgi:lipopolysaccharide/colanic/teichoic acid biosynthesis glycosyltransferase